MHRSKFRETLEGEKRFSSKAPMLLSTFFLDIWDFIFIMKFRIIEELDRIKKILVSNIIVSQKNHIDIFVKLTPSILEVVVFIRYKTSKLEKISCLFIFFLVSIKIVIIWIIPILLFNLDYYNICIIIFFIII